MIFLTFFYLNVYLKLSIYKSLNCIFIVLGRKDSHQDKYTDWRQLWHPNYEDYSRAEASVGYDNNTVTNVTVQLGATAYLHCRVRSSPDRTIGGGEVSVNFSKCAQVRRSLTVIQMNAKSIQNKNWFHTLFHRIFL